MNGWKAGDREGERETERDTERDRDIERHLVQLFCLAINIQIVLHVQSARPGTQPSNGSVVNWCTMIKPFSY